MSNTFDITGTPLYNFDQNLTVDSPVDYAAIDPYSLYGNYGNGQFKEANSPGYEQYGQAWLDILAALGTQGQGLNAPETIPSSPQAETNLQQQEMILKGQGYSPAMIQMMLGPQNANTVASYQPQAQQAEQTLTNEGISVGSGWTPTGLGEGGQTYDQLLGIISDLGPSGATSQNFNDLANYVSPALADAFGISPSDPNLTKLADAYISYLPQEQDRIAAQDAQNAKYGGTVQGIFSDIVGALAWTLASGGAEGLATGSLLSSLTGAEAAGATPSDLALYNDVVAAENVGKSAVSKSPVGALTSLIGPASSVLSSSGLAGGQATAGNAASGASVGTTSGGQSLGLDYGGTVDLTAQPSDPTAVAQFTGASAPTTNLADSTEPTTSGITYPSDANLNVPTTDANAVTSILNPTAAANNITTGGGGSASGGGGQANSSVSKDLLKSFGGLGVGAITSALGLGTGSKSTTSSGAAASSTPSTAITDTSTPTETQVTDLPDWAGVSLAPDILYNPSEAGYSTPTSIGAESGYTAGSQFGGSLGQKINSSQISQDLGLGGGLGG